MGPTLRRRTLSTRRYGSLLCVAVAVGVAVGMWLAYPSRPPVLPPPELAARLDPRLTALIERHVETVREHPAEASAHAELGLVYEANKMWEQAAASFRNAAELDPPEAMWAYRLAVVTEPAGSARDTLAVLDHATALDDALAPAHQLRGLMLLELDDPDSAIAAFQRVIEHAPQNGCGQLGVGMAELRRGNAQAAAASLEEAARLLQGEGAVRHALGLAYRALGRGEDAARELEYGKGAQFPRVSDPLAERATSYIMSLSVRIHLGASMLLQGRAAQAETYLLQCLETWPESAELHSSLANARIALGKHSEAEVEFRRSIELDSTRLAAYTGLIRLYLEGRRPERALPLAERAVRLAPGSGTAHLYLSHALVGLGRRQEGIASLLESVRVEPQNAIARLHLGRTMLEEGRRAEARAHLRIAAELAPYSVPMQEAVARECLGMKDLEGIERSLQTLRELTPRGRMLQQLEQALAEEGGR